jgi:hypothetical protein
MPSEPENNDPSPNFARAICKAVKGGKRYVDNTCITMAGIHTVIRSGILKPYLDKARSIPICIHPFASIQRAFYACVPEAAEEEEDP